MSMFRKVASAIVPAAEERVGDANVTQYAEQRESHLPNAVPAAASEPKPLRTGSKGAALLSLLQRDEGASLDEMIERTGWQGHTVRAAMTGLRKKGHGIGKRVSGNSTVWFIAAETVA